MKNKIIILLILILVPCTLFASVDVSDVVSNLIVDLLKQIKTDEVVKIPLRSEIAEEDKWDLSSLYQDEEEFLHDMENFKQRIVEAPSYSGIMDNSKEDLLKVLSWYYDSLLIHDKIYEYAYLNNYADVTDNQATKLMGTVSQICNTFKASVSYFQPELLASKNVEKWIEEEEFADYKVAVKKLLRLKEHTLTPEQEKILALELNVGSVPLNTYNTLTNGELKFKSVNGQPLTDSTYLVFRSSKDRSIREEVYKNYFGGYESIMSTLANLYYGSVKQDLFNSTVRGYKNTLEAALFKDDVDESVYLNLIDTVHEAFPILHRYYEIRRKALGLEKLAHYDAYAPLVDEIDFITPYEDAVEIVINALKPLGEEYTSILKAGLTTERWIDKYENQGKQSGAFSYDGYKGNPFLFMNYQENSFDNIFIIAHEGGHSMHTYYSVKNNPYSCFDPSIFHAEVASTFNEALLYKYLLANAKTDKEKAYYLASQMVSFVDIVFRQTMFAEFELKCHQLVEEGQPLTIETLRSIYRELLENYFGPDVEFTNLSDLEFLRISHFFNAYYVYQYATGLCASMALSDRVLNGGQEELDDYLGFLKSGGTMYPIDALKEAGVDLSSPEPIRTALKQFEGLLDEFEALIDLI